MPVVSYLPASYLLAESLLMQKPVTSAFFMPTIQPYAAGELTLTIPYSDTGWLRDRYRLHTSYEQGRLNEQDSFQLVRIYCNLLTKLTICCVLCNLHIQHYERQRNRI
ncbi:MAG: hypothetical protein ABFC98_07005 [Candidatus Cloacimonas sp.]